MSDVVLRKEGYAGWITLARPQALNALTYEMCLAIDAALVAWQEDPEIALILIDGEGPRAFCAGGDIAEIYATAQAGDVTYAQRFWRDEYRLNARIARYPKPIVSFLRGFTMGGGVGLGCHAQVRIVGESTQIALPECSIGLVPDVGSSKILVAAPGALGRYLGLTGARLGPQDAIHAGFADAYLPEAEWQDLKVRMCATGRVDIVAGDPPEGKLAALKAEIDCHFGQPSLAAIETSLNASSSAFAVQALKALRQGSPLSLAATLAILDRLGRQPLIEEALTQEYRFTYRALDKADFIEGIRAAIIDRDRRPNWRHKSLDEVGPEEVAALLAPLGADELQL